MNKFTEEINGRWQAYCGGPKFNLHALTRVLKYLLPPVKLSTQELRRR
jgi:hypothetical protein